MTNESIILASKEREKTHDFGKIDGHGTSNGVDSAYGLGFLDGVEWVRNQISWHPSDETPANRDGIFIVEWKLNGYDLVSYSKLTWRVIKRWISFDAIKNM